MIESITGKNLIEIDPETKIRHSCGFIRRILPDYRKSKDEVHRIVYRLDMADICLVAREKKKISFFFKFLDDLDSVLGPPPAPTES